MSTRRERRQPSVLFQDEHVLVINKPAGLLSVAARGDPVVIDVLREAGLIALGSKVLPVHRLDRGVSGVMVFALSTPSQQALSRQFVERTVEKVYWALVQGTVKGGGEINLPLYVDRDKRVVRVATHKGKPSLTDYWALENLGGFTLVECRPRTGRLHQIRVHMAAIGHPLAVDPTYGGGKSLMLSSLKADYQVSRRHEERPLIDRVSLHAAKLSFEHPVSRHRVDFEAPIPKDLRSAITQLRRLKGRKRA